MEEEQGGERVERRWSCAVKRGMDVGSASKSVRTDGKLRNGEIAVDMVSQGEKLDFMMESICERRMSDVFLSGPGNRDREA